MTTSAGAAELRDRVADWRVPSLTTSPSSNPVSWALQFGITVSPSTEDTPPLLEDPPLPPRSPPGPATMDSPRSVGTGFPSSAESSRPVAPAASVSSAASMTSSPGMVSRSPQNPPGVGQDDGDWGENSFEDHESTVTFKKLVISEASSDLASLKGLMRQGSWRAIVDMVKEVRIRSSSQAPDEQIVFSTYQVLALMKLRNYSAAEDELSALGDLNSPKFRFEQHPNFYPSKSGSMVPFGLRWLHAELPHRLGQTSITIDRLYDLLAHCNDRIDFLYASARHISSDREKVVNPCPETPSPRRDQDLASTKLTGKVESFSTLTDDYEDNSPSGKPARSEGVLSNIEDVGSNYVPSEVLEDDDFGEFVTSALDKESNGNIVYATLIHRWIRRQEVVLCSVLGHHLDQKDFIVCLTRVEELVRKRPQDVIVLSKYGYVQLQLGDLYGARRTFATIEAICEQQGRSSSPILASLLSRNRGLLYFSLKQYAKAVKEFDVVLEIDPGDIVSANNKALCLMYSRDLVGATHVLETVLQSSPITALNETLVLNLCSMYELASMNSVESKKTLSSWILRIAPDDFDLTCTRL